MVSSPSLWPKGPQTEWKGIWLCWELTAGLGRGSCKCFPSGLSWHTTHTWPQGHASSTEVQTQKPPPVNWTLVQTTEEFGSQLTCGLSSNVSCWSELMWRSRCLQQVQTSCPHTVNMSGVSFSPKLMSLLVPLSLLLFQVTGCSVVNPSELDEVQV